LHDARPILLSALISIPVGRFAYRSPRIGGPLLSTATLLYAIPALPMLIIVPVIFGVGLRSPATMIIALTAYGVALYVRTSADAFGSVDRTVRDSAIAMGYAPQKLFWQVDLLLATPVLIAGLRVVSVSLIGLVTICALIGVQILGTMMTDGCQPGIAGEVAVGIIGIVLLALVIDPVLLNIGKLLTPTTRRVKSPKALSV